MTPTYTITGEFPSYFYHADATELMQSLAAEGLRMKLIFMDPPFNYDRDYDVCDDDVTEEEYLHKLNGWVASAYHLLDDDGSIWFNLPDEWASDAFMMCVRDMGMKLENWCIWHYRFGVHQPNRFIKSKSHAMWFSKRNPIVNAEAALVPSDRAAIYNDDRIYDSSRGGMRMDLDVWGFDRFWGRVQGNNKERRPLHDNQLPELYMNRVIGVCSNPGDNILDPFAGSGTFATVGRKLKRTVHTGDISLDYLKSAYNRTKEGPVRL